MDPSNHPIRTPRYNVLTLDGGGVRGLSSLLILQDLMRLINSTIRTERPSRETYQEVQPHDVFHFVAGTSTGGLIAIMLGKLGMTVGECIQAFYNLSKSIFGQKRLRARITRGLAPTKYSGSHLERQAKKLIMDKNFRNTMPMVSAEKSDTIACAVICREHSSQSQYSAFLEEPVPICSLQCPQQVACLVTEAARATSAAPTFFPVQRIGSRYFVDGGMDYNNPSEAIFEHCTKSKRTDVSNDITGVPKPAPPAGDHDGLDFSYVRFVNLGTGTRSKALPHRQRDRLAQLVPAPVRMALFLKRTLTEFAVNSEKTAAHMRTVSWVSQGGSSADVSYVRFSADNGVCYIKMDKHKALDHIAQLTRDYLEKPETQASLEKAAREIAKEYLQRHPAGAAAGAADTSEASTYHADPPPLGDPPPLSGSPPQTLSTSALNIPAANKNDPANRKASSTKHEGDAAGIQRILEQDTNHDTGPTQAVPSRTETGHLPADAMKEQMKDVASSLTITT